MGATNGVSILLSQAIGAKDKRKTESLIATSLIVAIAFSLLITLVLELTLPFILNALNTPTETYDMAYSYLAIYVLGYVAVYLYLYFTAVLRSFGNSMFQAAAMLVSTILNAILDPIFIHFIGFHGAAIATLLSQAVCLIFMVAYLKKKKLFALHITWFKKKGYFTPHSESCTVYHSTKYSGGKHNIFDCIGKHIQYYCDCGVWNYWKIGNYPFLSGYVTKYGLNYNRWTVHWRATP